MSIKFEQVGKLEGHTLPVTTLALFKKSNRLVSGSRDQTVKLWNLEDLTLIKSFEGHTFFIGEVAISPEEDLVASAGWDCTVKLWNLEKLEEEASFNEHSNDVLTVQFMPNKKLLVSSGRDSNIKFFKRNGDSSDAHEISSFSQWVTSIRFDPSDNNKVLITSWDKKISIYDVNKGESIGELIGHGSFIECVDISPDGSLAVSGARDGMVLFWDLKAERYLQFVDVKEHVRTVKIDNINEWVYILTASNISIYDLNKEEIVHQIQPPQKENVEDENEWLSFILNDEFKTLFTGCTDGIIYKWNLIKEC